MLVQMKYIKNKKVNLSEDSFNKLSEKLEKNIRAFGENSYSLKEAASHHFKMGGKRTRAKLFFNAIDSSISENLLVSVASSVELIHEASLIHDDVNDTDNFRRGQETIWKKFGSNTAILLGDHLISSAFKVIVESKLDDKLKVSFVSILSDAIITAASGQHSQLNINHSSANINEDYEKIAKSKTGAILAIPLQFSVILNSEKKFLDDIQDDLIKTAIKCGEYLGLAYQIMNDLNPYKNLKSIKDDSDLSSKIITAPIIATKKLYPNKNPFSVALSDQVKINKILNFCYIWLENCLQLCIEESEKLPENIDSAIKNFINDYFIEKIDADFINIKKNQKNSKIKSKINRINKTQEVLV